MDFLYGKVAVDFQKQMLNELKRRAKKQQLESRIELINCSEDKLGVDDWSVCFARECGLKLIDSPKINMSQAVLFEK